MEKIGSPHADHGLDPTSRQRRQAEGHDRDQSMCGIPGPESQLPKLDISNGQRRDFTDTSGRRQSPAARTTREVR